MKRTKSKVLAMLLAVGVLCAGTVTALGNTETRMIDGVSFTATTQITETSAFAQTVSGSTKLITSVDATYYYVHETSHTMKYSSAADNGRMSSSVTFSVPDLDTYESYDISANHTAETSNESWSGSTYEKY